MAKDMENAVGLSGEQLQELLKTVVREARAPNEYEQEKINETRNRERNIKKGVEESVKATYMGRTALFYNCPHEKKDGRHAFVGQVNSDGFVRPVCMACGTTFPKFKAPPHMIQSGVGLQNPEAAYSKLPAADVRRAIMQLHKQSVPNCPEHCCNEQVREKALAGV